MKPTITTIILTYNEEIHIERCIRNAQRFSAHILIIDSFSTDRTVEIAEGLGATVLQNKWENNHAKQLNWGIENNPFASEWLLRLDADEYLSDELIEELSEYLENPSDGIAGYIFPRLVFFQDKLISNVRVELLRLWRYGSAKCENTWMDEHMILTEGNAQLCKNVMYDQNLNNIQWWTSKHNAYAIREAITLLDLEHHFLSGESSDSLTEQAKAIRKLKYRYAKQPMFLRAFLYFLYRYIVKGDFLRGKAGFLWSFFQGLWYRMLVDMTVYEIKRKCGGDVEKIKAYFKTQYKIEI